jgi:hypothetical protein
MRTPWTIERQVHFSHRTKGRREVKPGPGPTRPAFPGRVPRVARLMALALRFDQLVNSGAIQDYAELARLGHVTRARITQVMNLLLLAPDIQEALLYLPRTEKGRDAVHLRQLQPIAATVEWWKQRRLWKELAVNQT